VATGIDYGIVIVMMPLVLVGSTSGVLIAITLPSLVLAIILTVLLFFLSIQSLRNAVKMFQKETALHRLDEDPSMSINKSLNEKKQDVFIPDIRHF
jgi:uncharacterized membrane protein YfcA